jgi:alpha-D-xyloside xylohydrolase
MKFTEGRWRLRKGVEANHPESVFEAEKTADSLEVFAPVRRIDCCGDTLNNPMISVKLSSPLEGVIRVHVVHFKGGVVSGPCFDLADHNPAVTVDENDEEFVFRSGRLSARIAKQDQWGMRFYDEERRLTESGFKAIGYMVDADGQSYVKDELDIGVGECIYGLGERFTPFVRNGQVVDTWNDDGGTSSERSYKNVPFFLSSRGYGVFVNHAEPVSFEVGSEKVERVGFSVKGECLEYLVIAGPTPAHVLSRYTSLTGKPALPPAWSFGLWLTSSFQTKYDEETVTGFVQGMADRDVPLHVFHFDCFWMKAFHWIDLEWDPDIYPDPEGMLKRLKAMGVQICVWINSYVAQRSSLFEEAASNGYLVKTADGGIFQHNRWQAGMALIDFTNPDACKWYQEKLARLVDMGVDSFKTDFGEEIPVDVVYHDGSDPIKMHNYYTHLYNKTVFEILEAKLGKDQAVLFARSATAGGQQYPVHWGGDCTAKYESMAESLRGGLSLGLSGFGFWSHDMGGFESTASPDVYKRWVAFGCLSSHSRLHGSTSYRVPWLYDDESVDVLRYFVKLKCSLMPYLFQKAVEANQQGWPMMRAMCFSFPEDPGCMTLDRQYMLGDALLVAPVMDETGAVDFYLPDGLWTDFVTGESLRGGRWVRKQYDYLSLPLLARENCVVPVGAVDARPDYCYADDVTLHMFGLKDGASIETTVPDMCGAPATVISVARQGSTITVTPRQASKEWSVLLRGADGDLTVEGGNMEATDLGCRIRPETCKGRISVTFAEV